MAAITVAKLLRMYSLSLQNALVDFAAFAAFTEQYARAHIGEQPELISYLVINSTEMLHNQIAELKKRKRVFFIGTAADKQILVLDYLVASISSDYKQLSKNIALPYPSLESLPRYVPQEAIEFHDAPQVFFDLIEKRNITKNSLFGIRWKTNVPILLFPSNLPPQVLLILALQKVQQMLSDEKQQKQYLKRLTVAATNDATRVQKFFSSLVQNPVDCFEQLKNNVDFFFFCLQFCNLLKHGYENSTEKQGDTALLHSVYIIEGFSSYYKNAAENQKHRDAALQELELQMKKPPFFFTYETIRRFADSHGIALINHYSEAELQSFLVKSTISHGNRPPILFEIEVDTDIRYYIFNQNVLPLIQRFRFEAQEPVKKRIVEECIGAARKFEQSKLLKEACAYEERLEAEVKKFYPILYALLNSKYLLQIYDEERKKIPEIDTKLHLMERNSLLPYSQILLLPRSDMLNEVKQHLSIWYRVPIFKPFLFLASKLIKLVTMLLEKRQAALGNNSAQGTSSPPEITFDEIPDRKADLKKSLASIENQMVPFASTLEKELVQYERHWNTQENPAARIELTNKVNSVVAEYLQHVMKTANRTSIDRARLKNMAETIMQTTGMAKFEKKEHLALYIQYYMLFLLKSI